jgi:DNA repair exonuclease SbcCD ATPase subunit
VRHQPGQDSVQPVNRSRCRLGDEKYGLELDLKLGPQKPDAEDALYSILAAQHVNQEPDLSDITLELEASAWPLCDDPSPKQLDCESAAEAYRSRGRELGEFHQKLQDVESVREERERLESKVNDLRQENDAMLAQLHKVQLELEDYYLQLREEKKKAEGVEKAKEGLKKELVELKKSHEKAREKAKKDVSNMQRGIDGRDNTIREKARTIKELENRIEAIYASTSWRLTRPIRVIGKLLKAPFRR